MNKIKQLSFVLFIFSALAFSYPVTQGFAQSGGQCDSNPACDPTSGTCCNQCDPNPACVASDPHAIPCCSQHISGGDVRDPRGPNNFPDRRRAAPEDTRDPRDMGRPPARDPRAAAPREDTRGGGLSKRERVEACKKQYGKKKKNKAAKRACIAAAKGQ